MGAKCVLCERPSGAHDMCSSCAEAERREIELRGIEADAMQEAAREWARQEAESGGVAQMTERQPDNGDKSVGSRHGPSDARSEAQRNG